MLVLTNRKGKVASATHRIGFNMNEYDIRQLKLMKKKIEYFKDRKIYLSDLIHDLEGLLNVMEDVKISWEEEFRANWLELEIVFACCLDQGKDRLDEADEKIITEALENLLVLIESELKEEVHVDQFDYN